MILAHKMQVDLNCLTKDCAYKIFPSFIIQDRQNIKLLREYNNEIEKQIVDTSNGFLSYVDYENKLKNINKILKYVLAFYYINNININDYVSIRIKDRDNLESNKQ